MMKATDVANSENRCVARSEDAIEVPSERFKAAAADLLRAPKWVASMFDPLLHDMRKAVPDGKKVTLCAHAVDRRYVGGLKGYMTDQGAIAEHQHTMGY